MPEASQYIPSLKWENMEAGEWEGTEGGGEALKITVLSCSLLFGALSTAQKKTHSLSSNMCFFLFSSPSLPPALLYNPREDGRC